MTTNNPFAPASKVSKRLKVLIYGASGVGKTLAALTFPRPAVIDTEGGTDLYAGRDGIPAFSVMKAKSLTDVEAALKFIQTDNGRSFDTLIIDPITVLYDVQKDAAGKAAKQADVMTPREWNLVNKRMVALYNTLTNLPVHVVVIARESDLLEGEGLNLKRVGFKPDMDKKGVYIFDFIVRMKADRSGDVTKSRGVDLGKTMPIVSYDAFAQAAGMFTDGSPVQALSDDQAIARDAYTYADKPSAPVWGDELHRILSNENISEDALKRAKAHVWKLYKAGTLTNDTPIDEVFEAAVSIFGPDELLEG